MTDVGHVIRASSLNAYSLRDARWSHGHHRERLRHRPHQVLGRDRVFGYPGDGIGAFDGALGKADGSERALEYVRPTHEEIAALMATAHAKFTGEVGVCVATSSPGAFHMLNGLYDAQMDNQPVVAIVGQQGLASIGSFTQQESNLERVFADVACYVETVASPDAAGVVIDTAFRTAMLRKQPAVVVLPHDVQAMAWEEPAAEHWVSRSSDVPASTRITPSAEDVRTFAEILNAGRRSPSSSVPAPAARPTRSSRPPRRPARASSRPSAARTSCRRTCRTTRSRSGSSGHGRA